MFLIKYFYHKVFRHTMMNEAMHTLKQQAITNTLAKAKTLDPNNNLTFLNVLKTS